MSKKVQCVTYVGISISQYRVLIGMPILPTLLCQSKVQCGSNVGITISKYKYLIGMPILPTLSCQPRSNVLPMLESALVNIGYWLACQYCQRWHANQGPMWLPMLEINISQYRVLIGMPILPTLSCQSRSNVLPMLESTLVNIGYLIGMPILPTLSCQPRSNV